MVFTICIGILLFMIVAVIVNILTYGIVAPIVLFVKFILFLFEELYDYIFHYNDTQRKYKRYLKYKRQQKINRIKKDLRIRKKNKKKNINDKILDLNEAFMFKYICYFNNANIDEITDEEADLFKHDIYKLREQGFFDDIDSYEPKDKANKYFKEIIKM